MDECTLALSTRVLASDVKLMLGLVSAIGWGEWLACLAATAFQLGSKLLYGVDDDVSEEPRGGSCCLASAATTESMVGAGLA